MSIQQISVFLENRAGQLADITAVLAQHNIDMRAIHIAETSDYGVLRIIVDRPQKAASALLEHGFTPLDDYIRGVLEGVGGESPDQRLWRLLAAYGQFMEHSGELIGRYYQQRIAEPGTKSMDPSRYTYRAMVECFRQAEQEGILAPGHSPEWIAGFCFRHFRGVVVDWVLDGYSYPLLPKMEEDFRLFVTLFHA